MKKTHKTQITNYIKRCIGILLIIFVLLNLLFVAMGKISLSDFWLGILFIGGASWIFYRDENIDILGKNKSLKNE